MPGEVSPEFHFVPALIQYQTTLVLAKENKQNKIVSDNSVLNDERYSLNQRFSTRGRRTPTGHGVEGNGAKSSVTSREKGRRAVSL